MTKTSLQNSAVHPAQFLAIIKADDVKANIRRLWTMPYDADPLLEPEMVGLTCGQAILLRQVKHAIEGDGAAADRIMDRMIGKPEQTTKNLNLNGSYKDFLEEVAKAEGIIDVDGRVIT